MVRGNLPERRVLLDRRVVATRVPVPEQRECLGPVSRARDCVPCLSLTEWESIRHEHMFAFLPDGIAPTLDLQSGVVYLASTLRFGRRRGGFKSSPRNSMASRR